MIFKTENSTYEVDFDETKIRRIEGSHKPTLRQGHDGDWKPYESITCPMAGATALIVWYTETEHKPGLLHGQPVDDVFGIPRATETSPIVEIIK